MSAQGFKAARVNAGWTAKALADAAGVARQSVHEWDKGSVPRPPVAVKVAKLLGFENATDLWPVEPVAEPSSRAAT